MDILYPLQRVITRLAIRSKCLTPGNEGIIFLSKMHEYGTRQGFQLCA